MMAEREENIYKPLIKQNQQLIEENTELKKFIQQAEAMGLLEKHDCNETIKKVLKELEKKN